jgi:hypothetical protein
MHKGETGTSTAGLGVHQGDCTQIVDGRAHYKITTVYGCKWVIEFIGVLQTLVIPVLARSGDGEAIIEAIAWVALYMLQHGHVVKEILTNKGSAEGSDEVVREERHEWASDTADSMPSNQVERTIHEEAWKTMQAQSVWISAWGHSGASSGGKYWDRTRVRQPR